MTEQDHSVKDLEQVEEKARDAAKEWAKRAAIAPALVRQDSASAQTVGRNCLIRQEPPVIPENVPNVGRKWSEDKYMIISVASGKGGTGKTTLAVNLALSIDNCVQILDCDVEEPNAHLFLKPEINEKIVANIPIPEIDESKCTFCGKCQKICAYNAIAIIPKTEDRAGGALVFPHLCHSCGGCSLLCPEKAIKEVDKEIGIIEIGNCEDIQFAHGRLNIGEIMSPSLIRQVKGYINPTRITIIDAPPGTSCPVIAAVDGSDFCLLVTEPTPFGLNDLALAVEVLKKLEIPYAVAINRSDIGDEGVENYCRDNNIPILMRIPFDREIAFLYSNGIPIVEGKKEYINKFRDMFSQIEEIVKKDTERDKNESNCSN